MSLQDRGRGIAVPCDVAGIVDIDSLTEGLRNAYSGAPAMVGREYGTPTVQASLTQPHATALAAPHEAPGP